MGSKESRFEGALVIELFEGWLADRADDWSAWRRNTRECPLALYVADLVGDGVKASVGLSDVVIFRDESELAQVDLPVWASRFVRAVDDADRMYRPVTRDEALSLLAAVAAGLGAVSQ